MLAAPIDVGDAGDAELLDDPFVGGDDHEFAVDRPASATRVAVQHVHERGAEVAAAAQPQDHDRVPRERRSTAGSAASNTGAAAKNRLP